MMYFDQIKQMKAEELKAYNSTILDGRSRNKWYIKAICAVSEIDLADEVEDITYKDFSMSRSLYDSAQWVAKNDPEALKYIMGVMIGGVTQLVKEKLLEYLSRFNHQEAQGIVKKYLKVIPIPQERIIRQGLEEGRLQIKKYFIPEVEQASNFLKHVKENDPEPPQDVEKLKPLRYLLNLDSSRYKKSRLMDGIENMEFMRFHAPDELHLFLSITICKEIKDQLLSHVAKKEYFQLCQLIQTNVQEYPSTFYYPIPPRHIKLGDNDDEFFFDDDDDDTWWR